MNLSQIKACLCDLMNNCKTVYSFDITSGVREQIWGSSNVPHSNVEDIFNGPLDEPCMHPSHPNTPDTDIIVADWVDNTVNDPSNGTDQFRWSGWIFIEDNGTILEDNNANTGERIRIWLDGNVVYLNNTNTAGGSTGAGVFATVDCGWHFLVFEGSDLSAYAGVGLRTSTDGVTFTNFSGMTSVTTPKLVCKTEKCSYTLGPDEFDCIPPLPPSCIGGVAATGGATIAPSTLIPIADNEVDTALRTGQVGTSLDYARGDHNHPIRRQANPGDPVLTYLWDTGGSLNQSVILDRWSDEESYSYKFRVLGTYGAGSGWNYITVPAKAGFQQPLIYEIGTYRNQSIQPQNDAAGGQGGNGAAPRGPYMGKEAHHWSSTNRIYHGFFRRDNTYRMYTEFIVKYIRL